ncbi:hypothetical protein A7985_24265 [Pseudoalteromonas luteoviolacea]|uniref:RHS repeat-associated core domain-containing protein n=1 Tax=Pseudoalteromonas luteoviolacea TaxID=43657 RepID=A0A1C0TJD7_9GAMM|nr:RHS repeat-associated core domain-containing protein [Pseudoalteromonas luteoviolacea]OCQ18327.1 hypothetical protein A7985_24265 [Pseudoalteromonas luteoviolacea]
MKNNFLSIPKTLIKTALIGVVGTSSHLVNAQQSFDLSEYVVTFGQANEQASSFAVENQTSAFRHVSRSDQAIDDNEIPNIETRKITTNYRELFSLDHKVEAYTSDLFGERYSAPTGSVSFSHTDLSIPGNSDLPINLTRIYVGSDSFDTNTRDFGTWGLDLPHIRTNLLSLVDNVEFKGSWGTGKACTGALDDGGKWGYGNGNDWKPYLGKNYKPETGQSVWNGDQVYIPGRGSSKLIVNAGKKTTNQNWEVTCFTTDKAFEGFVVTTNDGVKYTFSQPKLVGGKTLNLYMNNRERKLLSPDFRTYHAFMLATRVEDKFGNWVEYDYDGPRLTGIRSSDDRNIRVDYYGANEIHANLVKYVTDVANSRVWKYEYQSRGYLSWVYPDEVFALSKVTRPDGLTWQFTYPEKERTNWLKAYFGFHSYTVPRDEVSNDWRICEFDKNEGDWVTIKHPHGAKGVFKYKLRQMNRSNVSTLSNKPLEFLRWASNAPETMPCSTTFALSEKSIKFSNADTYTWRYDYYNSKPYFNNDPIKPDSSFNSNTLPSLPYQTEGDELEWRDIKVVKVTQPDNSKVYHYLSARFGPTENKEIMTRYHDTDGATLRIVKRVEENSPNRGDSLVRHDFTSAYFARPKSTITYEKTGPATDYSDAYEITNLTFNEYDAPTQTKESSSQATRYIKRSYEHDLTHNVFNLLNDVSVSEDSVNFTSVHSASYEAKTADDNSYQNVKLLSNLYEYGQLKKTYATYTNEGLVSEILFNDMRLKSDGTRSDEKSYLKRGDFYRGKARSYEMPARIEGVGGVISGSMTVDSNGWVTSTTDFNQTTTSYMYDSMGRIKAVDVSGSWLDTVYEWDLENNTRTVQRCTVGTTGTCIDTSVFTTTEYYDNWLRLTKSVANDVTNGLNRTQVFRYDYANRSLFTSIVTDDLSTSTYGTTNTYDGLGRKKTQSRSGLGTIKTLYLANNKTQVTDAKGHVTKTQYLSYGSPSYSTPKEIVNTLQSGDITTSLTLDIFGNIKEITQSGGSSQDNTELNVTETRIYDSQNNLCAVSRPDVGNTLFGYNALGRMIWKQVGAPNATCTTDKPTQAISYEYDNLGDNYKVTYPTGDTTPALTYTHDNNGNVVELLAGDVNHVYKYNNQGLLEFESISIAGQKFSLEADYGYNSLMHRDSLTYPDSTTVNFAPNGFGEPTQVVSYKPGSTTEVELTFATKATYNGQGGLKSFTYGNNVEHTLTYDPMTQLPDILRDQLPAAMQGNQNNSHLVHLNYNYDLNANVTSIIDSVRSGYSLNTLTYDELNRLTGVYGGTDVGNSVLTYDALGNIETYTALGRKLTYQYDRASNRLRSVTGAGLDNKYGSIGYDARGNIIHNGAFTLDYNLAEQMVSAKGNTYLYDGHNRRVKQVESTGTSYSFYGQDGTLLYREQGHNIVGEGVNYIYLGKKLIAKYGHTEAESIEDSRQAYRPYGEVIGEAKDDVGYTGHKFDKELGLNYMQARYYDPVIGRFYSNDPVGFTGDITTFNRYSYVGNNPYKYTDPTGESRENRFAPLAKLIMEKVAGKQAASRMEAQMVLASQTSTKAEKLAALNSLKNNGSVKLEKSVANKSQVAEVQNGGVRDITGPNSKTGSEFKDAPRVASQHGGNAADYKKVSSSKQTDATGAKTEVHGVVNTKTNEVVEMKTKKLKGDF